MRIAFIPLFLAAAALAAEPVSLLPGDAVDVMTYSGPSAGVTRGSLERVSVSGTDFPRALRLTTASLPVRTEASTEYALRARVNAAVPAEKGDRVLAEFWMRCIEPAGGECATRLVVEVNRDPYTKSSSRVVLAGLDWRKVRFSFPMADTYGAGAYSVQFWMGQQVQTVEIGGVSILNYGQNVTEADLGFEPGYEGSNPDAAWRAAARERIQNLRKGELVVTVVDAVGNPVPQAQVNVRMTRHEFGFGTAVAAAQLLSAGSDSDRYRHFILDNFNMVVLENDLKWPNWEQDRQRALNGIGWLRSNGITRVRGHNLVWPSWKWLPADLPKMADDPAALRERVRSHIEEETSATRGLLVDWDVLNEPYSNTDLQRILGDEAMAEWFWTAKQFDPEAVLYINDYSILSSGGTDLAHRNHYFDTIGFLDALGAPVEGIGMQGHFSGPTPPDHMLRILDRFAAFNKPISITEYDFDTDDEALQAQFTRDLMTLFFSHPRAQAFLMWGFWEGRHWKPKGAMIRRDWSSKPMHDVWRDLVYREWWTEAGGATGDDGSFQLTGFKGDYVVEATAGGKSSRAEVHIGAEPRAITLRLD